MVIKEYFLINPKCWKNIADGDEHVNQFFEIFMEFAGSLSPVRSLLASPLVSRAIITSLSVEWRCRQLTCNKTLILPQSRHIIVGDVFEKTSRAAPYSLIASINGFNFLIKVKDLLVSC